MAAVHPRFQTPYVAIVLAAALGVVFVLLRTFEQLADTFVTAIMPFYALGVASHLRVAQARAGLRAAVPGARSIRSCRRCSCSRRCYLLGNAIIDPISRWATLAVLGVMLLGIPVYYLTVGDGRQSQR